MKKTFLSMLMIASCLGVANAQLMVDATGKTGVGIETYATSDTLKSMFVINDEGRNDAVSFIKARNEDAYGLYIKNPTYIGNTGSYTGLYVYANALLKKGYVYGVRSNIASGGSSSMGTIGVYGASGYSKNKRNYGVVGILNKTTSTDNDSYGAAVFGNSTNTTLLQLDGRYAGYFNGDTRVTGVLTAGSVVTSSDYRLKENIRSLSSSDGCLGKLMSMNVVEFNNKQREYEASTMELEDDVEAELLESDATEPATAALNKENADSKVCWYEEDSPIIKNKHYGLIAQELQKIYPDLVVESQDGYLAVNYLEIIPLLIRSVQELKAELDATQNNDLPIQKAQARTTDAVGIDAVVTTLYQNTPNPFTESTLIRCDVADDVVKADLYIYNMNGEQIAEYSITERGETSVTIDGGSLNAGMYLYALIVDGQVIDTKRMILTR